jgi:hypothetical protein
MNEFQFFFKLSTFDIFQKVRHLIESRELIFHEKNAFGPCSLVLGRDHLGPGLLLKLVLFKLSSDTKQVITPMGPDTRQ